MRHRLAVLVLGAIVALAAAEPAAAQSGPGIPVVGGYSYLREVNTGSLPATTYEIGWAAAVGFGFGVPRLSGVGEIGVSTHTTEFDERQQLFSVLGGARWDVVRWSRVTLYGQGLFGMERFSEPGYEVWGIALQPGGGADIHLGSRFLARVQADYRWSDQDGDTFHVVRVFVGAGVTLGRR